MAVRPDFVARAVRPRADRRPRRLALPARRPVAEHDRARTHPDDHPLSRERRPAVAHGGHHVVERSYRPSHPPAPETRRPASNTVIVGRVVDQLGHAVNITYGLNERGAAWRDVMHFAVPAAAYRDQQPSDIVLDVEHGRPIGTVATSNAPSSGLTAVATTYVDDIDPTGWYYSARSDPHRRRRRRARRPRVTETPGTVAQRAVDVYPGDLAVLPETSDRTGRRPAQTGPRLRPPSSPRRTPRRRPRTRLHPERPARRRPPPASLGRPHERHDLGSRPRSDVTPPVRPASIWAGQPIARYDPSGDRGDVLAFRTLRSGAARDALELIADGCLEGVAVRRHIDGTWLTLDVMPDIVDGTALDLRAVQPDASRARRRRFAARRDRVATSGPHHRRALSDDADERRRPSERRPSAPAADLPDERAGTRSPCPSTRPVCVGAHRRRAAVGV